MPLLCWYFSPPSQRGEAERAGIAKLRCGTSCTVPSRKAVLLRRVLLVWGEGHQCTHGMWSRPFRSRLHTPVPYEWVVNDLACDTPPCEAPSSRCDRGAVRSQATPTDLVASCVLHTSYLHLCCVASRQTGESASERGAPLLVLTVVQTREWS